MSKCQVLFEEIMGDPARKAEWERIVRLGDQIRKAALEAGLDPEELMPKIAQGDTGVAAARMAAVIDHVTDLDVRAEMARSIRQTQAELHFLRLKAKVRANPKQGLVGLVAQTASGVQSLENLINQKKATWIAQRVQRVFDEMTQGRWVRLFKDRRFNDDFTREFFRAQKRRGEKTQNGLAAQMAQHLHRTMDDQRIRLSLKGAARPWQDRSLKIKFNYRKIAKDPNRAVRDIAASLSEATHGPLERRMAVAKSMVDQIINGRGLVDLDRFGDLQQPGPSRDATPWAVIDYQDADAFIALNDRYGEKDLLEGLLDQMESLSKKDAVARMGLNTAMIERIGRELNLSPREVDKARSLFDRLTKVRIPEHIRYRAVMRGLRAIQTAAKLGRAVISALADLPAMVFVARSMYNVGTFDAITRLFRGPFGRKHAAYYGAWLEGIHNYTGNRFGSSADLLTGFPNRAADFILNASGLNLWTGWAKGGMVRMLDYKLGQLVRDGATWADIARNEPQLFHRMSRFGLTERDWGKLKQHHLVDDHLDLLQLPDELTTGVRTKERFLGFYQEATRTGVVTPGLLDRDLLEGDGSREFRKLVTQFLAYGQSVQRRLIRGTIQDQSQSLIQKGAGLARLMFRAFFVNMVAVQAREVRKGNELFEWTDTELIKRRIGMLPVGLVYSLFFDVVGGYIFDRVTGNKSFNDSDRADQLGVVLRSIAHSMEYGADAFLQDGKPADTGRRKLVDELLRSVPGQNWWLVQGAYRAFIRDNALEFIDPKGFRRSQKTARQNAREQRQGGQLRRFYGDFLDQLQ